MKVRYAIFMLAVACAACGGSGTQTNEQPASGSGGSGGAPISGSRGTPQQPASGGASGVAGTQQLPTGGASAGEGGTDAGSMAPDDASIAIDATMTDASAGAPALPPVTSVEEDGPFATTEDLTTGPAGDSGMFYPSALGEDGLLHPVFVWGCGGGSQPSSYSAALRRIASHGFVVIAEVSRIGDDGDVLSASLDWIVAENGRMGSAFFGKLDTTKLAAGGHSIGSVNTFFMASDPRLLTTIHVAGGSLDNVNDPFAPTSGSGGRGLTHPAALICSESDLFGNVEKTELDYQEATVPVFFTVMSGTEHVGAATEGLPAIVAWLRWHLGNETERRALFLEPSGAFQTGKYVSQIKNW